MIQKVIEKQISKKNWHKPELDTITADELKKEIVSGACSDYIHDCGFDRIGR